jgi:hypothetical protein
MAPPRIRSRIAVLVAVFVAAVVVASTLLQVVGAPGSARTAPVR